MLASTIWQNNLTKQKEIINKMYIITKNDITQVNRLSELIKRFMVKLSTRANI